MLAITFNGNPLPPVSCAYPPDASDRRLKMDAFLVKKRKDRSFLEERREGYRKREVREETEVAAKLSPVKIKRTKVMLVEERRRLDSAVVTVVEEGQGPIWSKYSSEQLKKINTQINTALDSKPEHVELYDHKAWNNEIPSSIFKCNTITVLNLRGVEVVATATNPSFVDLPSLKVLYLSNVTFLNREFVYNLLYSCPSLQDFSLKYCYTHHADGRWRTVPINYASLRELMPAYSSQYPFTLGERLRNLVSADVYKYPFTLQSLSNARTLRIDTIGYSTRYVFPIFYNIIHLELRYYSDISYGAIFQCLQNCPKLQTLKINKFDLRGRGRLEGDVPQCLSSHLKEFHLGNYRGLENEFKLARFIMNHARFLDIISIRTLAANSEEKEIMLQRLSSCFIRSANCKLLLE
ncbi:hypothetical protein K1719_020863 [Acacia pycnantha]|nr:hypothetical protein K1719_020863 [Acacia pycnantha]